MKKEIYLIIDCCIDFDVLFNQVKQALQGGADKVQLMNADFYTNLQISKLLECCHSYKAMLLINQDLDLAISNQCDGVHFDYLPKIWSRDKVANSFIVGVTVGNDESEIKNAINSSADYISFCSLYPTTSASNCELIEKKNIMHAAKCFKIKIYVAGGIKQEHLDDIKDWPIAGIAMITGITDAQDIAKHVKEIKQKLNP